MAPIVEGSEVGATESGLVVPASALPDPMDYAATYLTLDEYFDMAPPGAVGDQLPRLIGDLVRMHPRTTMLQQLALLNYVSSQESLCAALVDGFREVLRSETRARFDAVMSGKGGGGSRRFVARQPILHAMRLVLLEGDDDGQGGNLHPLTAVVLLAHATAARLGQVAADEEQRIGGYPASLAMEMVQNLAFYEQEDMWASMDRTLRLWAVDPVREPLRGRPIDLLRDATGLDVEDLLALGFALHSHVQGWRPGTAVAVDLDLGSDMDPARLASFFSIMARTPDALCRDLESASGRWDFLPFQRTPILRLPRGWVVLDGAYLWERVTSGLFWMVHDHEEQAFGSRGWKAWHRAYGEMVETIAEKQFLEMAPPLLDGGRALYTEEDFEKAYGQQKKCDAGVDYGDAVVLFEVVSGQLSRATRTEGKVTSFVKDTEKLVLKKARQLDSTAMTLLGDECSLTGHPPRSRLQVCPVVVVAGGYPNSPATDSYIREELEAEGLFGDGRCETLAIVDIGELEMLEGLAERGASIPALLRRWKASPIASMPLRNYVIRYMGNGPCFRPSRMDAPVDDLFDEIVSRLKLRGGR